MSKKLIKKLKTDVGKVNAVSRSGFIRSPGVNEDTGVLNNLTLYRYVYSSALSFVCILMLLASFLMQGFYVAYANELDASTDSITTSEIIDSNVTVEPSEEEKTDETQVENQVINVADDPTMNEGEGGEVVVESELILTEVDTDLISNSESSTTASTETVEETVDSGGEISTTVEGQTQPPSEEEVFAEQEKINVSTTSEEAATTTHESISIVQSDNAITFSKDDCTKLEDGSFYCREIEEDHLEDALFSARDQDGDLEIFLIRDGKQAQITENQVDDASPYFDNISNTLVWQRLIDDRFQIMSYDIESREEVQITDGSVNNMQPTRQGEYTVWQSWINDSWNIILYDGDIQKEITGDRNHNLAPHIQGSLVIWNKTSVAGEKTIEMYNIDSGAYVTVNDPDGLTVDNPRMVLVYDSLHPNGDIVTKGFDIFSGEFIQLDTLPKPLPEIPDSETTTEVKALIQPKPEVKSILNTEIPDNDSNVDSDEFGIVDLDLSINNSELATSTEMTLDLSQSTTTENVSLEEVDVIPDLVIPPFTDSTSSSTGTSTSDV